MDAAEGARSFRTTGNAYDSFMGRYSRPLADTFADAAGVRARGGAATGRDDGATDVSGAGGGGEPKRAGGAGGGGAGRALDVGCGPGALTRVLVERLGAGAVTAVDPSPSFVAECSARFPGVNVQLGRAEALPFADEQFDYVMAQLVLHFVTDAEQVAREFRRVLRPGGVAAACGWDYAESMQMLRFFWDAALELDPAAPDEARTLRFSRPGEIADLFEAAGFEEVTEQTLDVSTTYADFDELWSGFLLGIGPAGAYCVGLDKDQQNALRDRLLHRLGQPRAGFELTARARSATARSKPGLRA